MVWWLFISASEIVDHMLQNTKGQLIKNRLHILCQDYVTVRRSLADFNNAVCTSSACVNTCDTHTHTNTHTYIYIYIYGYMRACVIKHLNCCEFCLFFPLGCELMSSELLLLLRLVSFCLVSLCHGIGYKVVLALVHNSFEEFLVWALRFHVIRA